MEILLLKKNKMKFSNHCAYSCSLMLLLIVTAFNHTASYAQQTHTVPFETPDGIYGHAEILTKPSTFGEGYIVVDAKKVVFEGVKGNASQISFPHETSRYTLDLTGTACMQLNSQTPDCGGFSMNSLGHSTSDYTGVNFSQTTRQKHNDIRKETGEGYWETRGYVRDLQITNVRGDGIDNIKSALNTSLETGADTGNDQTSSDVRTRQDLENHQNQQENQEAKTDLERERERNELHEEHVGRNNERYASEDESAHEENVAESEEYLESKRKWEEVQAENQKLEAQYQQTQRNTEAAATLGTEAILIHYGIGTLIYSGIGTNDSYLNIFKGESTHLQGRLGYGFSYIPYRYTSGSSDRETKGTVTIDLEAGLDLDLIYGENYGLGLTSTVVGGHLLEDFHLDYEVGAKGFIGIDHIQWVSAYSLGKRTFWHRSWIESESTAQSDHKWRYGRLSMGPRISWNGNKKNLDFLFFWDDLGQNSEKYSLSNASSGFRLEYWQHNRISLFGEYSEYQLGSEASAYVRAGLLRTWDNFGEGAVSHDYASLRSHLFSDNKWVISYLNPIISWGSINKSGDNLVLDRPNLALNIITVEREYHLRPALSFSLGAGLTSFRGINGHINYQTPEPFLPNADIGRPGYLRTYSFAELDLPIGIQYYFRNKGLKRYWSAFKFQPNLNLGNYTGKIVEPQKLTGLASPQNYNYKFGLGIDIARGVSNHYRIGCYYTTTSGYAQEGYVAKLNGLHFQFALLY
ncbi:MAG: hypothetical protein WD266_08760 [Balneolales bacterium]